MANHKEKNLLNEITYLTRLIGQHKNGRTSSRKWETLPQKPPYHLNHKALSHPYFSASKAVVVQPYKVINTAVHKNNVRLVSKHQEKKSESVYINPESKSGLLPKDLLGSNAAISASSMKQTNVHINPHFRPVKSTKSNKVFISNNPSSKSVKLETVPKANQTVPAASSPAEKLKVLLNPKFCKLIPDNSPHTQLRALMTNKVHVNPKLVDQVLKEKSKTEEKPLKNLVSPLNKISEFPAANSCRMVSTSKTGYTSSNAYTKHQMPIGMVGVSVTQTTWRKSEFLALGNRKLVRVNQKVNTGNDARHKTRTKTLRSNFSLIRNRSLTIRSPSLAVKKAKVITSKYKLVKNHAVSQSGSKPSTNKYKIDRRSPATKLLNQAYNKSGESFRQSSVLRSKKSGLIRSTPKQGSHSLVSARSTSGNMVWRRSWSLQAKEFKTTNTKLYRIGNSPALKKKNDSGKNKTTYNKALVRIGGVLYKSSRNKLTISQGGSSTSNAAKFRSQVSLKKNGKNFTKGQVLCIRGQKFVMDTQGKTLRRLSSSDSLVSGSMNVPSVYSFRRVDIGGVTFVKKSSNVLMRTNTHKARSLLSYAKQRSIATLMKKLKKNNQPCIMYRKFGRCFRMEKGTCPCVHDRKHVAVCKRFLLGKCYAEKCLLSHDVVPEKMPTCKYFLEGCCNRQNCPYLHVKVNSKADICISFLQGYCANGKKCKKRHVCLCPEFEKTGKCVKGKNCPYPHETVRLRKNSLKGSSLMVKTSKSSLGSKKCSEQVRKGAAQPFAKNELTRYYLASKKIVGDLKNEPSSHDERTSSRELNDCSIPSKSEVSSSCGSVPVVASGDLKLSTSKRILSRDKIGSLPSFIPL